MPLQEQRGLKAGNREQIIRRLDEGRDDLYVFSHPPDNNEIEIIDLSAHTLTFGGRAGLTELKVKNLPIDSHWFLLRQQRKRQSLIADTFLHYLQTEGQQSVPAELKAVLGSPFELT